VNGQFESSSRKKIKVVFYSHKQKHQINDLYTRRRKIIRNNFNNMEIVLHTVLLLSSVTSASSLGLLRRTSVAASPNQRSLSQTFFSLPEEMGVLFSETRHASLAQMGYYHGMSMSFLSMPLPTNVPSHGVVVDGSLSKSPSAALPEATVTDTPHSPKTSTVTPVSVSPYTVAPSDGTSSDSNDSSNVKPIKTPVKTVTSKNTSTKTNAAKSQEWRPEIVLPVAFLALAALLVLGAVVARRRRRGAASVSSSNSSLSPSPSDTSVDATEVHGVEI
jgi:hypothetical protein